jgi:hypothetical protein
MNKSATGIVGFALLFSLMTSSGYRSTGREGAPAGTQALAHAPSVGKGGAKKDVAANCPIPDDSFGADMVKAVGDSLSAAPPPAPDPDGWLIKPGPFTMERVGGGAATCEVNQWAKGKELRGRLKESTVIFAFVPDPLHTRLALFVDRQIEAIQQAAAAEDKWVFDRALLPWENSSSAGSSYVDRQLEDDSAEERAKWPGLLLFRPKEYGNQRLLVFVIGEKPTTGINREQFRNAVVLTNALFSTQPQPLGIFGPTFSGSLSSLADLLNCHGRPKTDFPCSTSIFAFSGTITGLKVNAASRVLNASHDRAPVEFGTLQESDENAIAWFLDYATSNLGYCTSEIAVLSEDESYYGRDWRDRASQSVSGAAVSQLDDPCTNHEHVVPVSFPREISQLRNAFQQNMKDGSAADDKIPRRVLPLDLSATGESDTAEEYSPQSTLSHEAVLLGIGAKLRAHNVKMILLRASDPLDQLFLARYLRNYYPSGQIVTVGADLLLRREIEEGQLRGIMALSTYSLVSGSEDSPTSHVFPDAMAAGSYNAVKLLLAALEPPARLPCSSSRPEDTAPCACPPLTARLYGYGWPSQATPSDLPPRPAVVRVRPSSGAPAQTPPIHLAVLGYQGFREVAVLPSPKALPGFAETFAKGHSSGPVRPKTGGAVLPLPLFWQLCVSMVVALSLVYSWSLWSASMLSNSEAVVHLSSAGPGQRAWLFLVVDCLHFCLLAVMAWPYLYVRIFEGTGSLSPGWTVSELFIAFSMAVLLGTCFWDLRRRSPIRQGIPYPGAGLSVGFSALRRGWRRWSLPGGFALICAATLLVPILFCRFGYDRYRSAWRGVSLLSGVSPLFPLIMLACGGLWGVWYSLSGTTLAGARCPALARARLLEGRRAKQYLGILAENHERLLRLLKPVSLRPLRGFDWVLLVPTAACLLILVIAGHASPMRSFEGPGYRHVLYVALLLMLALFVFNTLKIWRIWALLRRLLLALGSLPFRHAFGDLEGTPWSLKWRIGAGNLGDFRSLLRRQHEAIGEIKKLGIARDQIGQWDHAGKSILNTYAEAMRNYWRLRVDFRQSNCVPTLEEVAKAAAASSSAMGTVNAVMTTQTSRIAVSGSSCSIVESAVASSLLISIDGGQAEPGRQEKENRRADGGAGAGSTGRRIESYPKRVARQRRLDRMLLLRFRRIEAKIGAVAEAVLAHWADLREHGITLPDGKAQPDSPDNQQQQLAACEKFLALVYASFINVVLTRIRCLVISVGGLFVFLLLALSVAYPFQPQTLIRTVLFSLFGFMTVVVGFVYLQMHRDPILCSLGRGPDKETPGELTGGFWLRMVSFLAVPVFSLLASQFPAIGSFLYSWAEPVMRALDK